METRAIETSDIEEITDLYVGVFNSHPWDDGWSTEAASERLGQLISHSNSVGFVCIDNIRIIGFVIGHTERWVNDYHFHLKEMCTNIDQQRKGVGTILLNALSEQLRAMNVSAIFLETMPEGPASAFYHKNGFEPLNLQSMIRRENHA